MRRQLKAWVKFKPRPYALTVVLVLLSRFLGASEVVYSTASLGNPDGDIIGSARAAAMGSAFVAVADDSSAVLWNQAGLADLTRYEIAFHHNAWIADINKETLTAGMPLKGLGGIGIIGHYIDYGTFTERNETGMLTGKYSANQMSLGIGIGTRLLDNTSVGCLFRGTQRTFAWESKAFIDADIGVILKIRRDLRVGASFANIPMSKRDSSTESVLRLGGVYQEYLSRDALLRAAISGDIKPQARNEIHIGVEGVFNSAYSIRIGYEIDLQNNLLNNLNDITAGAGIKWEGVYIDYAFLPFGELGESHQISVGYQFGSNQEFDSSRNNDSNINMSNNPNQIANDVTNLETIAPEAAINTMVARPANTREPIPSGEMVEPKPVIESEAENGRPLTLEFELAGDVLDAGSKLIEQGKIKEAAQFYNLAIKANPQDAQAWWGLGNVYHITGHKEYAIRCFEEVLKLRPGEKKLADWLKEYKSSLK